jgi:inositol phosphorylceramide mannosyltransferase catalytic subunit
MAIPKCIYQTFKSKDLPFLTRWHINSFRKRNPEYDYQFYDDARIVRFFEDEMDSKYLNAYQRINIGAAKADMFRYAVLYKKGGVYVDIDGTIKGKLDSFIRSDDEAIISREGNPNLYVQWALVYSAGHPFLQRTLDLIVDNIKTNRFPHDVHAMTGPTVYTKAINECLTEDSTLPHRLLGIDYEGHIKPKYRLSKFFLYQGNDHWKKKQSTTPVVKPEEI